MKNSRNLPHSEDKHYLYHNPQTGEVSMTIIEIGPGDEGLYSCTAKNPYGEVTATLNIDPDRKGPARPGHVHRGLSPECARMTLMKQQKV